MVYDRYRYSNARTGWGEIFGLSSTDLTIQQLEKMQADKLIEFIDKDSRIDQVLANTISIKKMESWQTLSSIKQEEVKSIPQTIVAYNLGIRTRAEELEKLSAENYYSNRRDNYVFWSLLDDENKDIECNRYLDKKTSVFLPREADFSWWYEKYPSTAEKLVASILVQAKANSNISVAARMVGLLPEQPLLSHIEEVFACDKAVYMHALSNFSTPKKYTIKALRSIAGKRRRIPSIHVELSKEILGSVPPVMRLNILETLFFYMREGRITFKDIKTSDDLQSLLFGTAIKQNSRVIQVISRFKNTYERRET